MPTATEPTTAKRLLTTRKCGKNWYVETWTPTDEPHRGDGSTMRAMGHTLKRVMCESRTTEAALNRLVVKLEAKGAKQLLGKP